MNLISLQITINIILLILPVLISSQKFIFDRNTVERSTCNHFDGFTGQCIKLSDCKYANGIFQYLENVRNTGMVVDQKLIDSYQNYLRRSHCGWDGKRPKVCCNPLPPIYTCPIREVDVSNRISEGTEAGIAEFPHMALLINEKVRGRPAFYCGGSLINERYVLTAAHCFYEPHLYDRVFIRLGEHDLNSDIDCRNDTNTANTLDCTDTVVDIDIEDKIIHEKFEPINFHNDIALIRLAQPVNYTRFIQPICLLDRDFEDNLANETFNVSGFGKMGVNGNFSNVQLKVSITGVSSEYCKAKYRTLNPTKSIIDTQFCAGGHTRKDTCHGDSGSPVIGTYIETISEQIEKMNKNERKRKMQALDMRTYKYKYLAGIVSYGLSKCGTLSWPGVYTKVSKYIEWIRSNMRP